MRIDIDSDRFVKEVIEGNEYSFLFKDLVVVDVGCNVGTFSFWIHKLAREIYAVDLDPKNIEGLNKTIQENKLDGIKSFLIAIAGDNRQRKYTKDPVLGGGGSQVREAGDSVTECITLKQFMDKNRIDYIDVLKIDVEGMEREVLSAGDFPKDRVHTIIGEIHTKKGGRRVEVKDVLEKMGFRYSEPAKNHFLARKI